MRISRKKQRIKRHNRVRAKIKGTAEKPRASVFRSNKHILVQIIDDQAAKTLVSSIVKSTDKTKINGNKVDIAASVGETLAKKAKEIGIESVVFDRGGYKYHGRVKAIA